MKLRELQKEFTKKGVKYTLLQKEVWDAVDGDGKLKKDGYVIYECFNEEYKDTYYEVFRYRIGKPHPMDTGDWDMVELYPSNEQFGILAWSCSDLNRVKYVMNKHFDIDWTYNTDI